MKYLLCLFLVACQGPPGNPGKTGLTGGVGPTGPSATPCTAASVTNGVEISCPDSPPLIVTNGLTGPIGLTGPAGSPGTVVTPIQFCPGTPSYPSTFPEYGLVIGSNIYAVYSTNGGFLALLPPGEYVSNAVGSSCDFIVNYNGTISYP